MSSVKCNSAPMLKWMIIAIMHVSTHRVFIVTIRCSGITVQVLL